MSIIVSDAAAEETLQAYTDPLSIQAKALDDLSEKVLSGAVVSDGNNPFTFLTEFASNMTATVVNKACACFNGLYPSNAQTATELYKHLSDFDYIGLYATPATTTVELVFDRNFLIDHAIDVNADSGFNEDPTRISGTYSKIVLPAYSKFTIGDYIFGLMYPIEIRVRKAIKDGNLDYDNSVITVVWDTSYQNPLQSLTSHILEHRDFLQDGQMLTAIEVPIYQFEVENHVENAIASTGFAKRYDFSNKFYAVRVFHFKNGEWNELAQTFSDTKYDSDVPTAIVKVLTDLGKVEVVIPHIYFNSTDSTTLIGNRILVKIYTTLGELNVDLSEYRVDQFQASFLLTDTNLVEDDRYSNMLKRIPTVYILPISTKIDSGTNGINFNQLKDRVKYNDSYTVQITPSDLNNYFSLSGYKFTKELDNITDRVYCAHKILKDGTGTPIASGQGMTYLSKDALTFKTDDNEDATDKTYYVPGYSNLSVLITGNDQTITIQPSALYKYDEENNKFIMLSDAESNDLMSQAIENRIASFNNNLYTYSPFHTVMSLTGSTPIAGTYDLFKPTIRDRVFSWENDQTTAELSIFDAKIEPNMDGDKMKGYTLKIKVYRTANLDGIPAQYSASGITVDNIRLMLSTSTDSQTEMYQISEYDPVNDMFYFNLDSDFQITSTGELRITSFWTGLENLNSSKVRPLGGFVKIGTQEYTLSLFMRDDKLEEAVGESILKGNTIEFNIPDSFNEFTLLCRQTFKVKLGEALLLLQNNISISTTDIEYETYHTTQFATYQAPIYARWTIDDNINGLCTVDQIGMLRLDSNKKPIIKHDVGDVILSSQYNICYGPTLTLTIGKALENLELAHDETLAITATSDASNVFGSLDGDLFVYSKKNPQLTGVYKLQDRGASKFQRVWNHQYQAYTEVFDTSIITIRAIYMTETNGVTTYSLTAPASGGGRLRKAAATVGALLNAYKTSELRNLTLEQTREMMQEYIQYIPTYMDEYLNSVSTLSKFESYCSTKMNYFLTSFLKHFSRLTTEYVGGSYESDASQFCVVSNWSEVSHFLYFLAYAIPETVGTALSNGRMTASQYNAFMNSYTNGVINRLKQTEEYFGNAEYHYRDNARVKACMKVSERWRNGSVPGPDYSRYHRKDSWMDLQQTLSAIQAFTAKCITKRDAFLNNEAPLSDLNALIPEFKQLAGSFARHWYHVPSRASVSKPLQELFYILHSITFAITWKWAIAKGGSQKDGARFYEDLRKAAYECLFPTDDDIALACSDPAVSNDYFYGLDLNLGLFAMLILRPGRGYFKRLNDEGIHYYDGIDDSADWPTSSGIPAWDAIGFNYGSGSSTSYSGWNSWQYELFPDPWTNGLYVDQTRAHASKEYDAWVYFSDMLCHSDYYSSSIFSEGDTYYGDRYSKDLINTDYDPNNWYTFNNYWATDDQIWWVYDPTYGYIKSINYSLNAYQNPLSAETYTLEGVTANLYQARIQRVEYIEIIVNPINIDPPEPEPEPVPEPEPEPEVEGLKFYSSNNDRVITAMADITPLREINHKATGYDRKWYLLDLNDEISFDFETYTGFVIEYGPTSTNDAGLIKSWNLAHYYSVVDPETNEVIVNCDIIATDLDAEGSSLDQVGIDVLKKDPYVAGYRNYYHQVRYTQLIGGRLLTLGETNKTYYNAPCTNGMVQKDEDGKPMYDKDGNVIYYISPKNDPWTVKWQALSGDEEDVPVVENIAQTEYQHRIRTVDALSFIAGYTTPLGTKAESYLYRSLDADRALVDPLDGQMFVVVYSSTDQRESFELNNQISYKPTEVDADGNVVSIVDEDVSPYPIEVGTLTARGALYYRDPEVAAFDYKSVGLDADQVYQICKMWSERRANGMTDTAIYDEIIDQFEKDYPTFTLNYTILRKIVSDTDSCYFSPWKKILRCSSANGLQHYVDYLTEEKLNPYNENLFGAYAGYISLMEVNVGDDPYADYEPHFINLVSIVDRNKQGSDGVVYTSHEFCVNPKYTSWNEIDHWPWEYDQPWICMMELMDGDHLYQTRSDISITYNSTLSCTKVIYSPDMLITEDGTTKVKENRFVTYGVDMIHCDYKLKLSEDAAYATYMEDIRELLRAYFNELKAITPTLLARTKLYFAPIRTFGSAEFKGSSGTIQTLPVQFSAEFGLHVESFVKNSAMNKETIRKSILNLIDQDMLDGTINLSVLAKDIIKELGDNVIYVDVLGLNGDKAQQTLIPVSEDTYPQLKQVLTIYDDNTVHVDRALDLDWYVIN